MEIIDLEMVRGDDDGWTFEITNEQGDPLDFTDCRFNLHIQPEKKGNIIKLSSDSGEIKVRSNYIDVVVAHDKTDGVSWTTGKWDLQCTDKNGKLKTLCGGSLELTHDVTRGV